jgi:hypothetical protein
VTAFGFKTVASPDGSRAATGAFLPGALSPAVRDSKVPPSTTAAAIKTVRRPTSEVMNIAPKVNPMLPKLPQSHLGLSRKLLASGLIIV